MILVIRYIHREVKDPVTATRYCEVVCRKGDAEKIVKEDFLKYIHDGLI